MDKQIDIQTAGQTDRQIGELIDRSIDSQTDRQTDQLINRSMIDRQMVVSTHGQIDCQIDKMDG